MRTYQYRVMGELSRQLARGLLRLRMGYIDAAEDLIALIQSDQQYPYEFVVFRITGYKPRGGHEDETLAGEALRQDLQTLILDLCDSFDCGVGLSTQKVYDTETLASHFSVSTKTIQRWRKQGLVARRMIFPNGKRRVAFLESSVERFRSARSAQIERSGRFTQLTPAERDDVVRRAKRMAARCDCCLNDVAKRVARKTGRALETIRYTIRNHDKMNPSEAIFPKLTDPLDEVTKNVLYRSFLRGVPVAELARRHKRTRSSIYRVINEMRARHLLNLEIDYIYNEEFDASNADQVVLAPTPPSQKKTRPAKPPKDLPAYLASLYKVPLLEPAQERHLFRKYNYVKYKADTLRKRLDLNHVRMADVTRIEALMVQANATKNQIIRANLRLVVSIARKHLASGAQNLFELISDGNLSLMRAVEKFDYSRGYKFSTYGSWAIMKNFARSVPRERYRMGRFMTGQEEALEIAAGLATYDPNEASLPEIRESLDAVLAQLSPRERAILIGHYGLSDMGESATLEELGRRLGISKERVRQIEIHALKKLRAMLSPDRAMLMR